MTPSSSTSCRTTSSSSALWPGYSALAGSHDPSIGIASPARGAPPRPAQDARDRKHAARYRRREHVRGCDPPCNKVRYPLRGVSACNSRRQCQGLRGCSRGEKKRSDFVVVARGRTRTSFYTIRSDVAATLLVVCCCRTQCSAGTGRGAGVASPPGGSARRGVAWLALECDLERGGEERARSHGGAPRDEREERIRPARRVAPRVPAVSDSNRSARNKVPCGSRCQ